MPREAFEELLRVAEAQLDAARRVDAQALIALNQERRLLQANFPLGPFTALSAHDRTELFSLASQIQIADVRTLICGKNVLSVLSAVLPDTAPTTYSRRGQLRGA